MIWDEIRYHVGTVLQDDMFDRWLELPIPALGNRTAAEMIAAGESEAVWAYVKTYHDTSYT